MDSCAVGRPFAQTSTSIPTTPLWTLKLMNQMSDVRFETVATRNSLDSHSPCS